MTKHHQIEFSVRPVTRYIVTRFESEVEDDGRGAAGSEGRGEFNNADTAYAVAYALAKAEHDHLGWPVGDERMKYPVHPKITSGQLVEDANSSSGQRIA